MGSWCGSSRAMTAATAAELTCVAVAVAAATLLLVLCMMLRSTARGRRTPSHRSAYTKHQQQCWDVAGVMVGSGMGGRLMAADLRRCERRPARRSSFASVQGA